MAAAIAPPGPAGPTRSAAAGWTGHSAARAPRPAVPTAGPAASAVPAVPTGTAVGRLLPPRPVRAVQLRRSGHDGLRATSPGEAEPCGRAAGRFGQAPRRTHRVSAVPAFRRLAGRRGRAAPGHRRGHLVNRLPQLGHSRDGERRRLGEHLTPLARHPDVGRRGAARIHTRLVHPRTAAHRRRRVQRTGAAGSPRVRHLRRQAFRAAVPDRHRGARLDRRLDTELRIRTRRARPRVLPRPGHHRRLDLRALQDESRHPQRTGGRPAIHAAARHRQRPARTSPRWPSSASPSAAATT